MDGADWPPLHFHECLVGWPCRCCPASDLGLLAERLAKASTAQPCGDRSLRTLSHHGGSFSLAHLWHRANLLRAWEISKYGEGYGLR